jgi:hypothetical protein
MRAPVMVWGLLGLVGVVAAGSQQGPQLIPGGAAPTGPTGTVIGRVICSDTQRPARFAQVVLRQVPSGDGTGSGSGTGIGSGQAGSVTETALDGSFVAAGVGPGDYYVAANAQGYVAERLLVQSEVNAGMSVAEIVAKLPVVHVTANGVASVTVTMDRGGTVGGELQWEDGSPATGVVVTVVSTAPAQDLPQALQGVPFYGTPSGLTDDRGRFRMTGLPAGSYVVRASLRGPAATSSGGYGDLRIHPSSTITVYSPGVFRETEAKPVTVKMGEERDDLRMVINLSSLRTVSGHVGVASGPGVTGGRVSLSDPNDKTIRLGGMIALNGDFAVGYVPQGTYTMQVSAGGPEFGGRGRQSGGAAAVRYQPVTQTVVVGDTDVTGVSITLVPAQAGP